jgi:glycosyltransferase involved in cell wall biosynthesis
MDKKYPLISVVIPCYKAEKYVARAVCSVLEQEEINVQIIVVEDGKFDNTETVLAQYIPKIEFVSLEKNRGACYARNVGLARAKADYVMFLDADDFIEGYLLRSLFNALESSGDSVAFGVTVSKFEKSDKIKVYYKPIKDENPMAVVRRWISGKSGPTPCAIMWRKNEVLRIGGWNESYSKSQDGEIIIRAMFNCCTVAYATEGIGVYWQHDNERLSNGADDRSFQCLMMLESYIENEFIKKGLNIRCFISALNAYRIKIARRAYLFHKDEYGKYFERKWIESDMNWISYDFIGLNYGESLKRYFLYNIFFRFVGIKRMNIIILYLKRILQR